MIPEIAKIESQLETIQARQAKELENLKEDHTRETKHLKRKLMLARRKTAREEWRRCLTEGIEELISEVKTAISESTTPREYITKSRSYYLPKVGEKEIYWEIATAAPSYGPYITYLSIHSTYMVRHNYYHQHTYETHLEDLICQDGWRLIHTDENKALYKDHKGELLAWLENLLEKVQKGKLPTCPCKLRSRAKTF